MPEDFDERARRAVRAVRSEAMEADARLEEPVRSNNQKKVAIVMLAAAAAIAGGFVVVNGGSSHKSAPHIATNGSTVAPTTVPLTVPKGETRAFEPASSTFISANTGWTLGAACKGSACPIALMHTTDGGHSWTQVSAPVASFPVNGASRGVSGVRFADANNGFVFGPELWSTHDGGASWSRVNLPGAPFGSLVLEIAGHDAVAVTISDHVTLWSSPVDRDDWKASNVHVEIGAGPIPEAQLAANGSQAWMLLVNRSLSGQARFVNGQWETWKTRPVGIDFGVRAISSRRRARTTWSCSVTTRSGSGRARWPSRCSRRTTAARPSTPVARCRTSSAARRSRRPSRVFSSLPATARVRARALKDRANGGATWPSAIDLPTAVAQLGFTTAQQGFLISQPAGSSADLGSGPTTMSMTYNGGKDWSPIAFPAASVPAK